MAVLAIYVAKMAEDTGQLSNNDRNKSNAEPVSSQYGGDHVFAPFAVDEDRGKPASVAWTPVIVCPAGASGVVVIAEYAVA